MLPSQSNARTPDQESFDAMLEQAREVAQDTGDKGAEQFFESAARWAADRRLHPERVQAMQELVDYYIGKHRLELALQTAKKLLIFQENEFGSEHGSLASTEARIGICHRLMRYHQPAIESLRSAVVRYQMMDDVNTSEFGFTLLELSHCYRDIGKRSQAKTCVKQAIVIVSSSDKPDPLLHASLLDEFGSLLYDSTEIGASIPVFREAIKLKEKSLGRWHPYLVQSLSGLGMSLYSQHEFALAESAFMEAAIIAQRSPRRDPHVVSNLLDKLTGTLRVQGRLAEAGMLEDGSKEFLGGQSNMSLWETYRKDMEVGFAAQKAGDYTTATGAYRSALRTLENFRHRNTADRISIQIRQQMVAEEQGKKVQAKTIAVEVEEELAELFGNRKVSLVDACLDMARLFAVQGKYVAAEAFFHYAERQCRKSRDAHALGRIAAEHSQVLGYLQQQKESAHYAKLARRLGFNEKLLTSNAPLLGSRDHMQPVQGERLLEMKRDGGVIEAIDAVHIEH